MERARRYGNTICVVHACTLCMFMYMHEHGVNMPTCTYMYMYIHVHIHIHAHGLYISQGGEGNTGTVCSIKDWKSETTVSGVSVHIHVHVHVHVHVGVHCTIHVHVCEFFMHTCTNTCLHASREALWRSGGALGRNLMSTAWDILERCLVLSWGHALCSLVCCCRCSG